MAVQPCMEWISIQKKNISVSQQQWFKIKWNALWCKVKQGGVIYGKKEGLNVFTFYMVKKFEIEISAC